MSNKLHDYLSKMDKVKVPKDIIVSIGSKPLINSDFNILQKNYDSTCLSPKVYNKLLEKRKESLMNK